MVMSRDLSSIKRKLLRGKKLSIVEMTSGFLRWEEIGQGEKKEQFKKK